ncbi:OLC1v1003565C1 [Oldenlandia corymbosa var. corymbosa]|uniref:OLC1v1003565C1 n=1 Tax=Oldenlandia corymbosa var. corymbosa TaxID=529605 RepID=A0AAV1DDP5_OLDCO|nr:OLC1v1003565C1 [Oldenlandia corymbosa var. corymbosa]
MGDIGDELSAPAPATTKHQHQQEAEAESESEAEIEIWRYVFGFTELGVVKCAVELGIADVLESQPNKTMSLLHLSSTLHCSPPHLYRILRFLTRRRIFRQLPPPDGDGDWMQCSYAQTPLSRLLRRTGEKSMAAFILFENSPPMLAPWQNLKARVVEGGEAQAPFDTAHEGLDVWEYARHHPEHSQLLNDSMSCDARMAVSALLQECPEVFDGIGTLVDVGGGDGTALKAILGGTTIKRGINFDLPHVVSAAAAATADWGAKRIQHVAGDFFKLVPSADAAFLMWVLHDWGDDECIKILKNCKAALPPLTGKVIILEAVIDDHHHNGEQARKGSVIKQLQDVGLMLDMVMMAHTTTGKERTASEWAFVLDQAGFSRHTIRRIPAVQSLIEAYP